MSAFAPIASPRPRTRRPARIGSFPRKSAAAFGRDSSTTRSGIAAGTVRIRDEDTQVAKTGLTVSETLAGLNRDTTDTGALKNNFDKTKVDAAMTIVGNLARETGVFVENQAKIADNKRAEAKTKPEGSPERLALEAEAEEITSNWGPGGTGRRLLTALSAGAGGNATGGLDALAQGVVANYVTQLGAEGIGQLYHSEKITK